MPTRIDVALELHILPPKTLNQSQGLNSKDNNPIWALPHCHLMMVDCCIDIFWVWTNCKIYIWINSGLIPQCRYTPFSRMNLYWCGIFDDIQSNHPSTSPHAHNGRFHTLSIADYCINLFLLPVFNNFQLLPPSKIIEIFALKVQINDSHPWFPDNKRPLPPIDCCVRCFGCLLASWDEAIPSNLPGGRYPSVHNWSRKMAVEMYIGPPYPYQRHSPPLMRLLKAAIDGRRPWWPLDLSPRVFWMEIHLLHPSSPEARWVWTGVLLGTRAGETPSESRQGPMAMVDAEERCRGEVGGRLGMKRSIAEAIVMVEAVKRVISCCRRRMTLNQKSGFESP